MTVGLQASSFISTLHSLGVTHVVGLPDNMSAAFFSAVGGSPIRCVPVAREGEAFGIAAGLWLGGAVPVVMIQNTGLLESGDALRGTITRLGIPMMIFVTYRGFASLARRTDDDPNEMTRADVDSAAIVTEPTLEAWRIPFTFLSTPKDERRLAEWWSQNKNGSTSRAFLLPNGMGA